MRNNKGFTLIELLIAIVIIGALSVVLIVIINPGEKQSQANDATIKSSMNKVVLSVEGFLSSYASPPTDLQLLSSLEATSTEYGTSCSGNDYECLFAVKASNMPSTCDSSQWKGTDTDDCYIRYYAGISLPGNTASSNKYYRIYAKSSGRANTVFVYDSASGGEIKDCPVTITDSDSAASICESL